MQSSKVLFILALFLGMLFTGFECASTELTTARLDIQQKNYAKAETELKKEIAKNPKSDEAWFLLGNLYAEKGNYDSTAISYDNSLSISNKYQKEISDKRTSFWVNQFKAGDAYFKKAIAIKDPDTIKINLDKSVVSLQNAINIMPDSSGPYVYLVHCYLALKETDNAVKPLEKLVALGKVPDGYFLLGKIYYDKGRDSRDKFVDSKNVQDSITAQEYFNKAISIFEKGKEKFPNEPKMLETLPFAYVAANKLSTAISVFKSLVESNPKKEYYFSYGVVLMSADKFEESILQYKKAIELDPNFKDALYNLAASYAKWGAVLMKDNEEKGGKNEEYKNKFREAVPYLEKLTQMDPKDKASWNLLGIVYTNSDNPGKAKDAFEKVDMLKKGK